MGTVYFNVLKLVKIIVIMAPKFEMSVRHLS